MNMTVMTIMTMMHMDIIVRVITIGIDKMLYYVKTTTITLMTVSLSYYLMSEVFNNNFIFKLSTWNCNGFKSCADYATQLSASHHVTFICEHWLLPHELPTIRKTFSDQGKAAFLRSRVDPLMENRGRPHGGIGFICDNSVGLAYKYEECDSDRICSLKVYKNQNIILTIYGVYLPYNDHSSGSMESYLECLDKLKCLVNDSDPNAPAVVVGDFFYFYMNSCMQITSHVWQTI